MPRKNYSKLTKKIITDKTGKRTTVWVAMGKPQPEKNPKKQRVDEINAAISRSEVAKKHGMKAELDKEGNVKYTMQAKSGTGEYTKRIKFKDILYKLQGADARNLKNIEDPNPTGKVKDKPKEIKSVTADQLKQGDYISTYDQSTGNVISVVRGGLKQLRKIRNEYDLPVTVVRSDRFYKPMQEVFITFRSEHGRFFKKVKVIERVEVEKKPTT